MSTMCRQEKMEMSEGGLFSIFHFCSDCFTARYPGTCHKEHGYMYKSYTTDSLPMFHKALLPADPWGNLLIHLVHLLGLIRKLDAILAHVLP